jgi:hypothetical protein
MYVLDRQYWRLISVYLTDTELRSYMDHVSIYIVYNCIEVTLKNFLVEGSNLWKWKQDLANCGYEFGR